MILKPKCPHCGSRNTRKRYRYHRVRRWRCRRCNRPFRRRFDIWDLLIVIVIFCVAIYTMLWWLNSQGIIEINDFPVPPISVESPLPNAPIPTPTAPAMVALPAPTATPTQVASVPTATPSPSPTETPELDPSPTATATRIPAPSPIPASYSIGVVSVEQVAGGQVDFLLEVKNEGDLAKEDVTQVEMSVDGGTAELVNIIEALSAGESKSFVFTRTLAPGSHTLRFAVGDSHTMVSVNVEGDSVSVSTPTPPPTATPTTIPTPTPVPTIPPVPTIAPPPPPPSPPPVPTVPPIPTIAPPPPLPSPPPSTAITAPETRVKPDLRHIEGKRYMLKLINAERAKAGLAPVVLGDNIAAQLHAEAALENCFAGHWGIDGLKPYMRYSLAGGYQSNSENGHGSDYCIKASERYSPIEDVPTQIRKAMQGWMGSPGHRRNILDRWHKKINIGLAWDRYNFLSFQHFEGDYVEYGELPSIEEGILKIEGRTKNGARFDKDLDLHIQIYYDPPTHSLTRGQVTRTYCYDNGLPVSFLREPLPPGWSWDENEVTGSHTPCPDPYDVPADAVGPRSHSEAHRFWKAANEASQATPELPNTVPWITALEWKASGEVFSVTTDLKDLLTEHGDGVYTVMVWGKVGGEGVVISHYSIFYGVTPPDTYAQ